jgi:hypothetical protein
MFYKITKFLKTSIAFHENLYAVIARSKATCLRAGSHRQAKQSQQGSQTTPRDCFANARNDNFLKCYTRFLLLLLIILIMLFAGCVSSTAVKPADQEAGESLLISSRISARQRVLNRLSY